MLGAEKLEELSEKKLLSAPLAIAERGRTLEDAYIILDEAQNTTNSKDERNLFLTRLGFNSRNDLLLVILPDRFTSSV